MKKFFFNRTKKGIEISTEQKEMSFASAKISFYRNPQKVRFEEILLAYIDHVQYRQGSGNLKLDWIEFMEKYDAFEIAKKTLNNGVSIIQFSEIITI